MYTGPNTATNGLVLSLDAANPKSYVSGSTTWRDLAGNNSGSFTNGPGFSSDNLGSITFDGVDDYITDIGAASTFSFIQNTGIFTISIWVKLNDFSVPRYFLGNNDGTTGARGFYFGYQGNTGRLWLFVTYGLSGQSTLSQSRTNFFTDSNWIFVTAVGNGIDCQFYRNGTPYGISAAFGTFSTGDSARTLSVGRINNSNSNYWNGNVSNVQIYNRPLTASEVLQNYNATKVRFGL